MTRKAGMSTFRFDGFPAASKSLRLAAVAATVLLAGCVQQSTVREFASCEEAQAVIADAGKVGFDLYGHGGEFRVFSDAQCFRPYLSHRVSVYSESIEVGGQSCQVGYSCQITVNNRN